MDQRTCDDCGIEFTPTHGRNRYCANHSGLRAAKLREYHDATCVQCGCAFRSARPTGKLCGDVCRADYYRQEKVGFAQTQCKLEHDHPVRVLMRSNAARFQERSQRRAAWESGDWHAFIAAVQLDAIEDEHGCWIWQRQRTKDGYPVVNVGKRKHLVHRMMLEAKHGRPLGSQAAHHMCATTLCVNPDHLQPVTARENAAEMLARTYMVSRIAELEAALFAHDPMHPLLREIGVA